MSIYFAMHYDSVMVIDRKDGAMTYNVQRDLAELGPRATKWIRQENAERNLGRAIWRNWLTDAMAVATFRLAEYVEATTPHDVNGDVTFAQILRALDAAIFIHENRDRVRGIADFYGTLEVAR